MKTILTLILILSCGILWGNKSKVTVEYTRKEDKSIEFTYTKTDPGTLFIKFEFTELNNSYPEELEYVISGMSGTLFTLTPTNSNNHISFRYRYSYMRGAPNPKVDSTYTYMLPFKEGAEVSYRPMTHLGHKYFDQEKPENFTALQFVMDKKETVCAMRKGFVVEVVDQNVPDTTKAYSFASKRNRVLIEHEDGTFANYTGFDGQKIAVKVGDLVFPNTPLGVLGKYDKTNKIQLRLSIYYRISTVHESVYKELNEYKSPYKYVNPFFLTEEGVKHLEPRELYSAKITEELIIKEFTRRELKKWQKKDKR